MNSIDKRISALREVMQQQKIDAYIIPTSDPHLSEYIPEYWQTREWLSGFTGSAGTLVVTQNFAGLWTDSRYWTQAENQLSGSEVTLQKLDAQNTHIGWLSKSLSKGSTVGIDGSVLALATKIQLLIQLHTKEITLRTDIDLIQPIWQDRPPLPKNSVYVHEAIYCGKSSQEKLNDIRQTMVELGADYHLVSSLDDIAWITNLRGSDVSYNPIFLAHLLIDEQQATLFIDPDKLTNEISLSLAQSGFTIQPYEQIETALKNLKCEELLIDPQKVSIRLIDALPSNISLTEEINPSTFMKSCKHEIELQHTREAMEEDGAALCEFYSWLEKALANNEPVTELTIDEKITEFRSRRKLYVSNSFSTIAAFNANGAQPHYRATEESHSEIKGDGLLLIDSGAQYHNGTTDITRVIPIGKITESHKRDFTLVLKAHIAMTTTCFPEGIEMPLLDTIARAPLWAEQLDYGHGTGHGVGYFLNVHEGPQVLSYHAPALPKTKVRVGMITSIEPGLYRDGQWGIRQENLVAAVPVANPKEQGFGQYLCFETLTLCPFETSCMDISVLTQKEIDWINAYHKETFKRLSPKLSGDALEWLKKKTYPI